VKREVAAARSPAVDASDELLWRDLRPLLDEAVAVLPQACQTPFVLCYLQGRTVSEVSRELGLPRGTVATRLALARRRPRVRLASRGLALSAGALAAALTDRVASARPPASLVLSTAHAAAVKGAQGVLTGIGSAADHLAQGGMAMFTIGTKMVAALLLAVSVAGGGFALYGQRPLGKDAPAPPAREAERGRELPAQAPRIVATVNGEPILAEDVYAAAYLALPEAHHLAAAERSRRITAAWGGTLKLVLEREFVLQDAFRVLGGQNAKLLKRLQETAARAFSQWWVLKTKRGAGLNDDQELRAFLRAQGTSLDAICRRWQRDFMAEEYLRNRVHGARGNGLSPNDQVAKQERERIIGQLRQREVIEYATGR
jgi:hypothetical protein